MKDERIRLKLGMIHMEVPTKWPRKLNSGKEKMKTLGTRIYSPRTNSEGKELLDDDEIRIRITLCLSSSNLMGDERIWHATYSS